MSADVLPTALGLMLVAAAAAFALVPFSPWGRSTSADLSAIDDFSTASTRVAVYRQLLELEFDRDLGKLSAEDFAAQASELLAQAGSALRTERVSQVEVDAEIESEIAAARAAFAAARRAEAPTS